ncbi:winged helix-turn-helix domain-containing protein [Parvularcula marina]|uniref:winged helix-turn-helix domain-containing protein n=1 Tax=Parvularcula marina TaxID=2292771 RepID=UPI00351319A6
MAGQIRLILLEPDAAIRAALVEQFAVAGEFHAIAAADVDGLPDEESSLSHIDVLLTDEARPETLAAAAARGFRGPVIAFRSGEGVQIRLERPCRFSTLAATIRSALHDHTRSEDARFQLGPYEFSPAERVLAVPGEEPIRLTDKEAAILRYLYRAGTRPVSREELLGEVWGYQSGITTHTLETHIYRLRQKIEPDPSEAKLLITVEGGYRLGQTNV